MAVRSQGSCSSLIKSWTCIFQPMPNLQLCWDNRECECYTCTYMCIHRCIYIIQLCQRAHPVWWWRRRGSISASGLLQLWQSWWQIDAGIACHWKGQVGRHSRCCTCPLGSAIWNTAHLPCIYTVTHMNTQTLRKKKDKVTQHNIRPETTFSRLGFKPMPHAF